MNSAGEMGGATLRDRLSSGRKQVRRHRWLFRIVIALVVLVGLAVLIRLIVDPIATHYTRKGLSEAEGINADFQRVHVTIFPPGYEIRRFKLREGTGGGKREPLFYVEAARVGLDWRELFHAHLTGSLTLERPKVTVVRRAIRQGGQCDRDVGRKASRIRGEAARPEGEVIGALEARRVAAPGDPHAHRPDRHRGR